MMEDDYCWGATIQEYSNSKSAIVNMMYIHRMLFSLLLAIKVLTWYNVFGDRCASSDGQPGPRGHKGPKCLK